MTSVTVDRKTLANWTHHVLGMFSRAADRQAVGHLPQVGHLPHTGRLGYGAAPCAPSGRSLPVLCDHGEPW